VQVQGVMIDDDICADGVVAVDAAIIYNCKKLG
jgi:hypothetical protein